MRHGELPPDLTLQRTTPDFDPDTIPAGLRRAHQIAAGVWGLLEVLAGSLRFVWEERDDPPIDLVAGDSVVIPPETFHHVEPGPDVRFHVSFYR